MFTLDYPELPGAGLAEKYEAGQGSNRNTARQSSINLRKKLEREGYLAEFNQQILDAVNKGEFVEVNDEVKNYTKAVGFCQGHTEATSYNLFK